MTNHEHRIWGPPTFAEEAAGLSGTDTYVHEPAKSRAERQTSDEIALRLIEDSLRAEQQADEAFGAAMAESDEATGYLLSIIKDGKERHHQLLTQLAIAIGRAAGRESDGYALPIAAHRNSDERERLLVAVRHYLAIQRDERRHLQDIAAELKSVNATSLWPALLDVLISDTEKNEVILRRIERMTLK